jgi:hypothetical protein
MGSAPSLSSLSTTTLASTAMPNRHNEHQRFSLMLCCSSQSEVTGQHDHVTNHSGHRVVCVELAMDSSLQPPSKPSITATGFTLSPRCLPTTSPATSMNSPSHHCRSPSVDVRCRGPPFSGEPLLPDVPQTSPLPHCVALDATLTLLVIGLHQILAAASAQRHGDEVPYIFRPGA